MGFLFVFAVLVILDYVYFKLRYVRPKGPPVLYGLPFIGFLPIFILPRPVFRIFYKIFLEKMPDIFIARLVYPTVIVKDPYITEVQKNNACLNRSTFALTNFIGRAVSGKPGWLFFDGGSEAVDWRGNRRTNLQALYILPRAQKFSRIAESANVFLQISEERGEKLWDYENDLMYSMIQTASNLNLGRVFESNSVQGFLDILLDFNRAATFIGAVVMFVPVSILKLLERYTNTSLRPMAFNRVYKEFWRRVVYSTKRDNPEPTNYVEAVLRSKKPEEAYDHIRENIFFVIGAETVTMVHSTVTALSHLAVNPYFQQKLSEELVSVVGKDELSADHLDKLHYLKAVCTESLRISSPVVGISRHTSEATKVGEYELQADMSIALCFHSETFNAKHFPDPYVFNPERFINKDCFEDNPKMAVFSRGRRNCPGAEIAKMTMFIYVAKILQHFKVVPKDVNEKIPVEFEGGITPGIPKIPLKFIMRTTAPPITELKLPTGLDEIYEQVLTENERGKLVGDF